MNFYFCETCGKRITDVDLAEGQGRDKKLKGVFCKECAIGVMTLETLPISNDEARKILGKAPAHDKPPRRSTESHVLSASERRSSTHASRNGGRKFLVVAGLTVLGTACIGVFLATFGSGAPAPKKPSSAAPPPVAPKAETEAHPPATKQPAPRHPADPGPKAAPRPAGQVGMEAFEHLLRFEGLAESDAAGHVLAIEGYVHEFPQGEFADRARKLLEEWNARVAVARAPPAPKDPLPVPIVPPALVVQLKEKPRDDAADARSAYLDFQTQFLDLLRGGDRQAAAERLGRAEQDPALQSVLNLLAEDRKALAWAGEAEAAFEKGLDMLKDAGEVELRTLQGRSMRVGKRAEMQFVERNGERLYFGSKGASFPILLGDLSPASRMELSVRGCGSDAGGLLKRAFLQMLALGRADAAPTADAVRTTLDLALASGAPAGDVEYLRRTVEVAAKGAHAILAGECLKQFDAALQAQKWSEAYAIGRRLLDEFSDTAVVQKDAGLKERVASATRKGAPIREYTLTLQQGQPLPEAGLQQYSGTFDTYVGNDGRNKQPMTPSGKLITGEGRTWFALIGFKLLESQGGPLPAGTEMVEAKLHFHKLGGYDPLFALHGLLVPWKAEEATYTSASKDVAWSLRGADVAAEPAATFQAKWNPGWCEFVVTAGLREALKDGKFNGWLVHYQGKALAYDTTSIASSRHADPALRPKLVLKVRCPRLAGDKP